MTSSEDWLAKTQIHPRQDTSMKIQVILLRKLLSDVGTDLDEVRELLGVICSVSSMGASCCQLLPSYQFRAPSTSFFTMRCLGILRMLRNTLEECARETLAEERVVGIC